jgi:ferredoxin-NADP reductase
MVAADAAFYLCGPPAMQDAVLAELAASGVAANAVQKEAFVFNSPKTP